MHNGFTLVELSIVLVIIGLLIGGILVGQSLINSAKINSVIKEISSHEILVNQYKLKFNNLPGDDPLAFNKFGSACGANDFAATYGSSGCNGNANGSWDFTTCCQQSEREKAWVHLYLSGMTKTRLPYWGLNSGGSTFSPGNPVWIPGQNMTQSTWSKSAGYRFHNKLIKLVASFGQSAPQDGGYGALSPIDARAFDAKLDDGVPTTGEVVSAAGVDHSGGCVSGGQYKISDLPECWTGFQIIK